MKKKISINMSKLSIGGMEKALVDLLNNSDLQEKYDITLTIGYVNKTSNYLKELPNNIHINLLHKGNWNIIGKIKVLVKLIFQIIFAKKYFCSICYTHHHKILSILTRRQSTNSIIFVHTDLLNSRTKQELKVLINNLKFEKFKKVICVSECAKKSFISLVPNYKGKVYAINNYIDGKLILKKSKDIVKDVNKSSMITFINVARHDESHKKISRILDSSYLLNKEGYKFRVLLIGNGKDTKKYEKIIDEKKLKNVYLLGPKENPFPYYSISDAFVFSSKYEGYGIVLNEARVLNVPIITTDVADASIITKEGYGILCKNNDLGIYMGMKEFLTHGYKIKKEFDYKKFNNLVTKKLNIAIEGE